MLNYPQLIFWKKDWTGKKKQCFLLPCKENRFFPNGRIDVGITLTIMKKLTVSWILDHYKTQRTRPSPEITNWSTLVHFSNAYDGGTIWTLLCLFFCKHVFWVRFCALCFWVYAVLCLHVHTCVLSWTLFVLLKTSHRIFLISDAWGCTPITLPYQRLYELIHENEMQLQILIRKRWRPLFLWREKLLKFLKEKQDSKQEIEGWCGM